MFPILSLKAQCRKSISEIVSVVSLERSVDSQIIVLQFHKNLSFHYESNLLKLSNLALESSVGLFYDCNLAVDLLGGVFSQTISNGLTSTQLISY